MENSGSQSFSPRIRGSLASKILILQNQAYTLSHFKALTWCAHFGQFTQQYMQFLIRPVMEDSRKNIQVSFRQVIFKKISYFGEKKRENRIEKNSARIWHHMHIAQNFLHIKLLHFNIFYYKKNSLTRNKWHSVIIFFRFKVTSHLNDLWQVKYNNWQSGVGFCKLVCHGTSATCARTLFLTCIIQW